MAGNIAKRANGKWRARYRDESGKEHSRHFDRKIDAQQWLDAVTSAVVTGTYADPQAGRITFAAFFGEWSARQVWAPGTVLAMSLAARSVPFAGKPMKQVRRSDVETWIKQMNATGLAPGTIKTRYVNVRSVFRAAVKDRVIGTDPTDAVRLPGAVAPTSPCRSPHPKTWGSSWPWPTNGSSHSSPSARSPAFGWARPPASNSATSISSASHSRSPARCNVSTAGDRRAGAEVRVRARRLPADSLVTVLATHVAAHGTTGNDRWLFAGTATARRTRTPSATGGARPCATPNCPASSFTTCGTSTPPASSPPGATS